MAWLLFGLGMVMIFEGLVYALAPSLLERVLEALRQLPEQALRQIGGLVAVTGFLLIWLAAQIGM